MKTFSIIWWMLTGICFLVLAAFGAWYWFNDLPMVLQLVSSGMLDQSAVAWKLFLVAAAFAGGILAWVLALRTATK